MIVKIEGESSRNSAFNSKGLGTNCGPITFTDDQMGTTGVGRDISEGFKARKITEIGRVGSREGFEIKCDNYKTRSMAFSHQTQKEWETLVGAGRTEKSAIWITSNSQRIIRGWKNKNRQG